jgi:hypothetical protein
MTKTTVIMKLALKRTPPPNRCRSFARVSTSMTVATLGANYIASTSIIPATPASHRIKSAGVGVSAAAALPISKSPIQAGEPRNMRMAKASW